MADICSTTAQIQDQRIFAYSKSPFPGTLDLISSDYPEYWTKMIDLTGQLSPEVIEYNQKNPSKQIRLLAKAEFLNPGMSHKDRIARQMLEAAVESKELDTTKTIIAASSGNTGASIALVGKLMGYQVIIITDSKCSTEKKTAIITYGATLWVLNPGFELDISALAIDEDDEKSVDVRKILHARVVSEKQANPNYKVDYMLLEDYMKEMAPDTYFSANQYNNPDNMAAHFDSTGQEIMVQTVGKVTHFVMSASTGGTVMGVGGMLKKVNPSVKIVLADPKFSNLFVHWQKAKNLISDLAAEKQALKKEFLNRKNQLTSDKHERVTVMVEGAGKSAPTGIMEAGKSVLSVVDDVIVVEDIESFAQCRKLAATTGYLAGGSSGLNLAASISLADQILSERDDSERNFENVIVTLMCDHGIKYLSKVYNDSWLTENFHHDEIIANKWLAKQLKVV